MDYNSTPIPETRGRPNKYDFTGIEAGDQRTFKRTNTHNIRACVRSFLKKRDLPPWEFILRTIKKDVQLYRIS